MGAELAIDIDVRISDELRDLLRQRRPPARPDEAPVPVVHRAAAPDWQRIVLRQDGGRPMVFRGLPLFQARRAATEGGEVALGLFLAEAGDLRANLAILPPEGLAARPIHRALALSEAPALARWLRDCVSEACLDPGLTTDAESRATHASASRALRAAFISMAADCLTQAMLPA